MRARNALLVSVLLVSCARGQTLAARPADGLPLGLYEVTERSCENPLKETDDCPLIQYIELLDGVLSEGGRGRSAIVVWLAPERAASRCTYEARPLRGRWVDDRKYLLDEYGNSMEWIMLHEGSVREYAFVRYRTEERNAIVFRMHFDLKAIVRTAEIDQRLPLKDLE